MSAPRQGPTFDELLGPLIGRGFALAVTMLSDVPAAEDVVQEAAIKAWRKLPGLRDHSAIESWFLSIVANECRSLRRSRWWSVVKWPEFGRHNPAQDRRIDALDLDNALDRLRPEERLPLLLHFYMDLTFEQVGRVMGVSMTAARTRTYRALARLRKDLKSDEAFGHG